MTPLPTVYVTSPGKGTDGFYVTRRSFPRLRESRARQF